MSGASTRPANATGARSRSLSGRRAQARRGYSLLEMMIVLGIVGAVAAVSWPLLSRPLNRSRVQDAAQQLSREMADARLEAIRLGQARFFRYQSGTDRYSLDGIADETAAADDLDPRTPRADAQPLWTQAEETPRGDEAVVDPRNVQRLPEGVTFSDVEETQQGAEFEIETLDVEFEDIASPETDWSEEEADADGPLPEDGSNSWSPPIVFEPDGRSTNHRLTLLSDDGYAVDITLRGLTGTVRIEAVRRRERLR